MRKLLFVTVSLVFVSAIVAAQHLNTAEPIVKGNLTLLSDVVVGTTVLKTGAYRFVCDRETITFSDRDNGKTMLKVPCKGRQLPLPSAETQMHVKTDASGNRVASVLLLKGSNVEHVF